MRSVFKSEAGRREITARYEAALDRAAGAFPLMRRTLETSFGRTHLIEAGPEDGAPLLLLHGTSGNSSAWLGDIPRWSEEFRVIAADIPGEPGLSADRRLLLAREESTFWLESLLDALGLSRVRLVGISLGGWMALRFAMSRPERVEAVCALSPSGLAPARVSFLLKALPLLVMGDFGRRRVSEMVLGGVEVPEEMEELMLSIGRHFRPVAEPVPVFADEELAGFGAPLQVFAGARDNLLHAREGADRTARLVPHARVRLLPDAGHVITGVGGEIAAFMRGGGGGCEDELRAS